MTDKGAMKNIFQSRMLWVFLIVLLFAFCLYAFIGNETSSTDNNGALALRSDSAVVADNTVTDAFSWGGVKSLSNADADAKQFVMSEKDYGGHPAYSKARHLQVCANLFETRKDVSKDLADSRRFDPSGESEELILWKIAAREEQCKDVAINDFKKIDELMHIAAMAGDVSAQSYELRNETNALIQAHRNRSNQSAGQELAAGETETKLLERAVVLAEKGDKEATFLAAKLTTLDYFGQRDDVTSAAWMLLGVHEKGAQFSVSDSIFESPLYAKLTTAQREQVVQKAQAIHNRCCLNR